jgi:hypothetical protein
MEKKLTKEKVANFLIKEYHNDYKLDFGKSVTDIPFSNCFLLKIFNSANQINRLYLVYPIDRLVAETSQPFYEKILRYFENIETSPLNNYWIAYVEIDENYLPQRSQIFQIPDNLRNNK